MAVDGITATYIAVDQFSVTGNQTADFHAGRRVKAELTGGDVYSTISGSVFGAVTTVTLYDSELDNTLTKVWYGIGWGGIGSLPDHIHDGAEGSGGSLDYLALDGSTSLTGDWDFGSFTISGTGDIWCNDLHTAGASLYIGDVQLSSYDSVLNYGSNTISGTGALRCGVIITSSANIELNSAGSGNRYAYIDFVGDDTYTDFGFRVIRLNTGANADSELHHRGTGDVTVRLLDGGGEFVVESTATDLLRLDTTGLIVGDAVNQAADYPLHVKDSLAYVGIDGNTASSNAGIILEKQGNTQWLMYNDGANADTFIIESDSVNMYSIAIGRTYGDIGIGYKGPNLPNSTTRLSIIADESSGIGILSMYQHSDDASGSAFSGYSSRGADQVNPTAVQADDVITGYNAWAHDGTNFFIVGRNRHRVEAISGPNIASYWELYTSDSIGTNREVMRMHSTGRLELYEEGLTLGNSMDTVSGTLRWSGSDIEGYKDNQWVSLTVSGGGGVTNHALLSNLDYASAAHTGFVSIATTQTITGLKTFSQDVTINADLTAVSGTFDYVEITDSISEIQFTSASGIIGVAGDEDLLLLSAEQLTIQGTSGGSIEFSTASGTLGVAAHTDLLTLTSGIVYFDGDVDVYGHVAIGPDADIDFPGFPTYEILLNMNETFDASIVGAYGINLQTYGAADSGSAIIRGINANTAHKSSGQFSTIRGVYSAAHVDENDATGTDLHAIYGSAYTAGNNTTITNIIGGYFTAGAVYSMVTASGTNVVAGQFRALALGSGDFNVTNTYGVQIRTPGATYNGTLTNLYGLYIEDMTSSSMSFANEYNIYSAGATSKNYFAGDVVVSGTIYSEDILFGANTISGTGDIYCNDLYTSGTSVHIGDNVVLSETGGNTLSLNTSNYFNLKIAGSPYMYYDGTYLYFGQDDTQTNEVYWDVTANSEEYQVYMGSDDIIYCYRSDSGTTSVCRFQAGNTYLRLEDKTNTAVTWINSTAELTVGTGGIEVNKDISFTVSGTSDIGTAAIPAGVIYCNDIYTAGGTVYIGAEQISSTAPGVLDFGGAEIQNVTGINEGVSDGGAIVFVQKETVASGTSSVNFDLPQTAKWLKVVVRARSGYSGNDALMLTFNNDSSANYDSTYYAVDALGNIGGSGIDGVDNTEFRLGDISGTTKPGRYSPVTFEVYNYTEELETSVLGEGWFDFDGTDDGINRTSFGGTYTIASGITSMQLTLYQSNFIDDSEIIVYGYGDTSFVRAAEYTKGRQELFIEYSTTSGIDILPGRIDIEDGSNQYALQVSGTLFKDSNSLSASTWYYVYAKPPVSGNYLSDSEIELSTTAPTRNTTKRGYYHGSNTDWRCFSAFYTNSSNEVTKFYADGISVYFQAGLGHPSGGDDTPSNVWTDQPLPAPLWESPIVLAGFDLIYVDTNTFFYWRPNGETHSGEWVYYCDTDANKQLIRRTVLCDDSGIIETKFGGATTNTAQVYTYGFVLPDWIAPK